MTLNEWLTIAAVILGPIFAVQVQRRLEAIRDRNNRRLGVFHTLMATRAARLSHPHVQALNQIDIEFYGRKRFGIRRQTAGEKAVTNAWRIYSDHLNNRYPDNELLRWVEDGDKLLAKLLFEMSRALGYDFDEVELRRNVYSPVAHGKLEAQEASIRIGLERLLAGQSALAVVTHAPLAPVARATVAPPASLEVPRAVAELPPLQPPDSERAT